MAGESSQTLDELAPWKKRRFRDYELYWTKATESLDSNHPLIEVKPNKSGSRWTVYDKATGKIAIFCHAAVWAWSSPPETGNFVPDGEVAPEGSREGNITSVLDYTAEISYALNTAEDPSFYTAARLLEDHVTSQANFNRYKKPRRQWQEGLSIPTRRRFVFTSRLVVYKNLYNTKDGQPLTTSYKLHPWIDSNVRQSSEWIPNPDRPSIVDFVDGKLNILKPVNYRYFDRGDIVWFSFALVYVVRQSNWQPEFKPLDFVRVGRLPASSQTRVEYSVEDEVGAAYRSFSDGSVTLFEDSDEGSFSDGGAKRQHDADGDETMSDGGLSDLSEKSSYSVSHRAVEAPRKRTKVESSDLVTDLRVNPKGDDVVKRKSGAGCATAWYWV
ncbi:hypothetical protein C8R43DRAFT_942384 [Mycena crocata]|nr:hypothetical protein C8R43DRAFT_942384 [Mycena crocata]